MHCKNLLRLLLVIFFSALSAYSYCQENLSTDSLFAMARRAAFDQKDYGKAKAYLAIALDKSPDYSDLRIFLGRIYSWSKERDSARACFDYVIKTDPTNEDVYNAYADLEYWNDDYKKSLSLADAGLRYHPNSEDLLIKKARALRALKKYDQALTAVRGALAINKNNAEAKKLEAGIKEDAVLNSITLGYTFVYFDKQFANPWHLLNFDYGRVTPIGKVIGRLNYANRFATSALQLEVDAYPHISKTFYCYVNGGFSADTNGVFPRWRAGFSLYANLGGGFEGELGFRFLKFTNPIWIYTASLGKYYKKWLFTERVYLVPGLYTNTLSASFSFSASYYWNGDADNLIGGVIGYGISPDDRATSSLLNTNAQLTSFKLGVFYKRKISPMNVLSLGQSWQNIEYLPGVKGNQFQFDISWTHRF